MRRLQRGRKRARGRKLAPETPVYRIVLEVCTGPILALINLP